MKRIALISLVAAWVAFCSYDALLYAISIGDYTVINDYDSRPLCTSDLPEPLDTFNAQYDKDMCIYVYLKDVSDGDTDLFKWFYQDELHSESKTHVFTEPSWTGCHGSCLSIRNTERAYLTGWWSVEVYINGILGMSESFYLQGLPAPVTTSSTSTVTTTTSYEPNPCVMSLIYGEYSKEAQLLRYYRDEVLNQTAEGSQLIKLYYLWSPVLVGAVENDEEFKEEVKGLIDRVIDLMVK